MKKRKLCKFVTQRGTRRSSRKTNYNVLYDMHIHPQDSQLEQMANTGDEAVEENDEVISVESSGAAEEEGVPVARDTTGKLQLSLSTWTFRRFDVSLVY